MIEYMRNIVIIGSGGCAREAKWLIEECNCDQPQWKILGWISQEKPGTMISGLPVLGDDKWLLNCNMPIYAAVSVGDGSLRKKIVNLYEKNENILFPNIISPTVSMSDTVRIGKGCIIAAQNIFTVDITIGDFFVCNSFCTVGHDTIIKDYVSIFSGAHISGNVTLNDGVSIGTGANIIQGITVGENSFIGAGAAVVRDIPAFCTAAGVPARPLKKTGERV